MKQRVPYLFLKCSLCIPRSSLGIGGVKKNACQPGCDVSWLAWNGDYARKCLVVESPPW